MKKNLIRSRKVELKEPSPVPDFERDHLMDLLMGCSERNGYIIVFSKTSDKWARYINGTVFHLYRNR